MAAFIKTYVDHVNFVPSFGVTICYPASRETSVSD
jgi:hypothetical protein